MAVMAGCNSGNCPQDIIQYEPSLAGNAVLLVLFAILIPLAFVLGIMYRSSIFVTTVITGLALEVMGYIGRVLLAHNKLNKNDFVLSHVGTIIGPVFICLAVFRLLPRIVAAYGQPFRAWRPTWHNVVFYMFTAVCLVLQTAGAVLSGMSSDARLVDIGIRLLVAGLAIQVSSLLIFALLGIRFAYAVHSRPAALDSNKSVVYNTARFKAFLVGVPLSVLFLLIRTLYRIVPVSEGFSSQMAQNEILFLVLDGVMVLVTTILLLGTFPGRMLDQSKLLEISSYSNRVGPRPERPYRSPPAALMPTQSPTWNRMSLKSNGTGSPNQVGMGSSKPSPRRYSPRTTVAPPASQRNMVDSDALW